MDNWFKARALNCNLGMVRLTKEGGVEVNVQKAFGDCM
jgi:hypothetical protein